MTITPKTAAAGKARRRYDWDAIVLGEWQNWLDLRGETVSNAESLKLAERTRLAAHDYARRHGLRLQSRRNDHGRVLDLCFTERD